MNISEAIKSYKLPALLSFYKERSLDWNDRDQEWIVKRGTVRLYRGPDEEEAVAYLTGEKEYVRPQTGRPNPRHEKETVETPRTPEQLEESRMIFSKLILPKEAP